MKRVAFIILGMCLLTGCGSVESDLVIRNGTVIDGTGTPGVVQDVAITDGKISAIGLNLTVTGQREIDATGMAVAPGFIDAHSHSDEEIREIPSHHNMIRQGVTTSITGNCGMSPTAIDTLFADLEANPATNNIGIFLGHNPVRQAVIGDEAREPTPEELNAMANMVEEAMQIGALGFSSGLIYAPSVYSNTAELIELAKAAKKYGGVYASHIRGEGPTLWDAVEEAIQIGREAQIPVQISHIKIATDAYWGQSGKYLAMLRQARDEGIVVHADQYPYIAGSTHLGAYFPEWSRDGGRPALIERMKDAKTRERIVQDTVKEWARLATTYNRAENIYLSRYETEPEYEGKSLAEICELLGREPTLENGVRLAVELVEREDCNIVGFYGRESDVTGFMRDPYVMVGSDGGCATYGEGVPHPRYYGTYPRILGRYVREQGVLTLEEAVRKMTSLPAEALGISDRGVLAEGKAADVVIFDSANVIDNATFQEPHQYPTGIPYVIVNGELVVDNNQITDRRPGEIIRGPGYRPEG